MTLSLAIYLQKRDAATGSVYPRSEPNEEAELSGQEID